MRCLVYIATIMLIFAGWTSHAVGATKLKNICRIKGQEENTLRGIGLVVGLNGTGEANDPLTMRALGRSMEVMGNPLAMNAQGANLDDLRRMKNSALVIVTATVPATGARRGDLLDCHLAAINGKSLAGGRLAFASLQGPNIQDKRVYALCQGHVTIDDPQQPMVGVVVGGCQMEADVRTQFYLNGRMTLVLDKNHANFQTVDSIRQILEDRLQSSLNLSEDDTNGNASSYVRAVDASNIEVLIPKPYYEDPVGFATELLETTVFDPEPEARVVVNPRAGTIVISGDVEIGDVIVSHKNVVVEAGTASGFTAIDPDKSGTPRLDELVNQLNSLKVPSEDMIEIIRVIDRSGKLHGRLIIE